MTEARQGPLSRLIGRESAVVKSLGAKEGGEGEGGHGLGHPGRGE